MAASFGPRPAGVPVRTRESSGRFMLILRGARTGRLVRYALAASAVLLAAPAAASAADTYIVQLKDAPLASYTGGKQGIPGTSPLVTGNKLKADSANGLNYRSLLASRQKTVLDRVPGSAPNVVESYRFAFAGFSAEMTQAQADALKKDPSVAQVWKDTLQQPMQAAGSPDARLGGFHGDGASYLRLTDPTVGLWNKLGGPTAAGGAGSGVIVG